jgi:hypothetical protein
MPKSLRAASFFCGIDAGDGGRRCAGAILCPKPSGDGVLVARHGELQRPLRQRPGRQRRGTTMLGRISTTHGLAAELLAR